MSDAISICIPVFNGARYLGALLDSLMAQSLAPAEIVVSNNKSTDETATILAHYPVVRVVEPERHLPIAANFNFVASQAKGDWIIFLGADDLVPPDFTAKLARGAANAGADAVLLFGGFFVNDEHGVITDRRSILSLPARPSPRQVFTQLVKGTTLSMESVLIRRNVFAEIGGFDSDAALAADWALYLALSQKGAFINLRRFLGIKRMWQRKDARWRARGPVLMENLEYIYRKHIRGRFPGDTVLTARALASFRQMAVTLNVAGLGEQAQDADALAAEMAAWPVGARYDELFAGEGGWAAIMRDAKAAPAPVAPGGLSGRLSAIARRLVETWQGWR